MTDIEVLKKYVYRIKTFESNLLIFHRKDNLRLNGHIINLNDYNDLKAKINYEKNRNKTIPSFSFDIKDYEKIMTIRDIEFKTSQYLTNMLLNGNKYIIVDGTFWKAICEKGKENSPFVNYEISHNTALLKVKLNDGILNFDNRKNNILEESNLKNKLANNFDLIKKAYHNVKSYFDFEIKIQNYLESKKESKNLGNGYLIEKDWIDKWKQHIRYKNIKNDLILNKSEKEIRDKLIYIFEENKYKIIDLNKIKNNELKDKQKIEECLKKGSLVLVSSEFIDSFEQSHSLNEINYNLYENSIKIDLGFDNCIKIKTTDNIIPQFFGETGYDNTNNNQNSFEIKNSEVISEISNNKFAIDILTILLNFNLEQKEFIYKVENSKKNINSSVNDYYLVNSVTFFKFMEFFSFVKIDDLINYYNLKSTTDIKNDLLDKIIKESKAVFNKLSSNKYDFFKKFRIKKFFYIKSDEYRKYYYPCEFQIVSKNIKEELYKIFDYENYINYSNIEEISLGFITGKIIFKPNKGKFFDENKNFLYIFSLSKEINGIIKFTPEMLIQFNGNNLMVNYNFRILLKDKTLIDIFTKNISDVNKKYDCKAIIINKEKNELFTESIDNSIKSNAIDYISLLIKLNEEYSKLEKLTKEKNNQIENDCYLINKNLMEGLEDILCFKEIDDIININKDLITEKQKLDKILKEINSDTKKRLTELDENKIKYELAIKELKKYDLDKAYMNNNEKKFYYENCKLISKGIVDIIKDMIKIYIDKVKSLKCIFDKGEIIVLIKDDKDEVINIGNLEKGNDLKIKSVIEKWVLTYSPSEIFSQAKMSGYDYIKKIMESLNSQNFGKNNYISMPKSNQDNNIIIESPKLKYEDNQKYINQIEELKKQLLEEKEKI